MSAQDNAKKSKDEELAGKEKMVAEYQARLKGNEEMVREVQKILDGFHKDHQEMAAALQESLKNMQMKLANEKEERLRSFTQMMTDIHSVISRIQKEVEGIRTSAENYCRDCSSGHRDMATAMFVELEGEQIGRAKWNKDRIKEFESLMKNMNQKLKKSFGEMRSARYSEMQRVQKDVSAIIQDADNLLEQFAKNRSSMSSKQDNDLKVNMMERVNSKAALMRKFDQQLDGITRENKKTAKNLMQELGTSRKDLAQIDKERLKEFKTSMDGIRKSVQEMREHVHALLDEFTVERLGTTAQQKKPAEPQGVKSMSEEKPQVKKPAEPQGVKSMPEEKPQVKKPAEPQDVKSIPEEKPQVKKPAEPQGEKSIPKEKPQAKKPAEPQDVKSIPEEKPQVKKPAEPQGEKSIPEEKPQAKKPAEPQGEKSIPEEKPQAKKPAEPQGEKSIPEEEPKSKPKASVKKASTKPRKPLQSKDAKKAPSAVLNAKETGSPVNESEKKNNKTKDFSLEDKVLNFINTHKQGVTIVDMENQPVGESRMKLSYITEQLLDDGKIQKVKNMYYPKSGKFDS